MKLKPRPLGWIAAICTAIFIIAGMTPVTVHTTGFLTYDSNCGSPWGDLSKMYYSCTGSHVGAIVIMSIAAAVGITCLILFAVVVLPKALRPDDPSDAQAGITTAPGVRQPTEPPAGPQRLQAQAGWYIDPHDSSQLRWWTGDLFSDAIKPREE